MEKKYVYYMRCSTRMQGESKLGLQSQKTFLKHFFNDGPVMAEFVEVGSGTSAHNRPKLQEAIKLCQDNGYYLAVAKIDRLGRNTEEALAIFRTLSHRIVSADIPMLDEFSLTLYMAIATREALLCSLRTKGALTEKRKRQGEWRKGNQLFLNGEANKRSIASNKEKAERNPNNQRALAFLRNIDRSKKTLQQIADELNESGFQTSRGKEFKAQTVSMLLKRAA